MKKLCAVLALCLSAAMFSANAAEGFSYYNDNFSVSVNNFNSNHNHGGPHYMDHGPRGHMPPPPPPRHFGHHHRPHHGPHHGRPFW